jgi:ABC-type multidrug transport system fused ATPase/permease subunit
MRFALTQLIYLKTMKLSNTSLHEFGLGRLMNMVSNDFNDMDNGLVWIIQLCMLPINLSVATYALWRSFAEYSIVGLLVLVLSLKLQDMINKTVKEPIKEKNKISDKRIFYCKELVKHIKTVKMYVWESELLQIIGDLRKK